MIIWLLVAAVVERLFLARLYEALDDISSLSCSVPLRIEEVFFTMELVVEVIIRFRLSSLTLLLFLRFM